MAPHDAPWELLDGLGPEDAESVRALGERLRVPSGTALITLGDPAERFFVIESGRIGLFMPLRIRDEEQDVVVTELATGQLVGWSALVAPYRYTLGARAVVDAEVTALSRESVAALVAREPRVGVTVMGNLARIVARRMQKAQAMWVREVQRSLDKRLGDAAKGAAPSIR